MNTFHGIAALAAGIAAAAALAAGAIAAPAGDPARGEAAFKGRCGACHSLEPGKNGVGPSLSGLLGRKTASTPNYAYSAGLQATPGPWSSARLDAFLAAPQTFAPGTKMPIAVPAAQDRADLIAYFARINGKKP